MKAFKIDVVSHSVYEVEITKDIKDINQQLECEIFTAPYSLENNDCLFVDDEGLLVDEFDLKGGFYIDDLLFFGHGLFIGIDDEGESVNVKSTLDEIKNKINFIKNDLYLKYKFNQLRNNSSFTIISF